MTKRLDHIGIAVQDINDALKFFESALGMKLEHVATEEGGKTDVAFLPIGESEIELVQTHDPESGLGKFLAKRGEGIHHICFEVDDIRAAMARLQENGAQLIDETPRVNASGMQYAFIHPKSAHGVLIELYQKATEK
ncbi:MAG: methylmalonyl-CoA epimerase [Chloroflexota bacterium]|nr:MAG: methylmalonyl-CoA epimerase [Chloroflexota bacterium]